MIEKIVQESSKKVETLDLQGEKNGFLVELFKEGEKTTVYLTAIAPGAFKGYHEHRVRAGRYFFVRGRATIKTNQRKGDKWVRSEHVLDSNQPSRLFIPKNVPNGLKNDGEEEVWLINFPDPPYDPSLKDEQVDYTQEELERGIVK
jgi:dTDP-4-dehydrorhamnose 3,5-epimerase-like enzyme